MIKTVEDLTSLLHVGILLPDQFGSLGYMKPVLSSWGSTLGIAPIGIFGENYPYRIFFKHLVGTTSASVGCMAYGGLGHLNL